MSEHEPSEEQRAILHCVRTTNDSLIIDALAGSGKTSTLIECIEVMPQATAVVLAFNKRIAEEMARRMPKLPRTRAVHVKTLHATGLWITTSHYPQLKVDKNESERLISQASDKGTSLKVRGAALKLLRIVKDFQHELVLDREVAYQLGFDFGALDKLETSYEINKTIEVTQRAYVLSLDIAARTAIDFCDMGWLPIVLGLQPPHRYKAVLLDEAQDINPNQLAMVDQLLAPGGRVIACGDRWQAIYGWRGATPDETWRILEEKYKARSFPLTTTWRCDQAIVEQANELVPELRARPEAEAGTVSLCSETAFYDDVGGIDGKVFVLSRNNADLLRVALEMWRRRISFNIAQSPEVIAPLKGVIGKLLKGAIPEPKAKLEDQDIEEALSLFHDRRQRGEKVADKARKIANAASTSARFAAFRQNIAAWYMTEMMKAQASGSSTMAERVEDQHRMVLYCMNYVEHPGDIMRLLDGIFTEDDTCWITLSTVHKAKGLEADHVFLLRETFMRYHKRRDADGVMGWIDEDLVPQEEKNIEYVAVTRAKHALTWVCLENG